MALANLNNLLPDIELGIHCLQDQMHGLKEIAYTVMEQNLLLTLEIVCLLDRLVECCVGVHYLLLLISDLLLCTYLVLLEVLETVVQDFTDRQAIVHQLLDHHVVKVVLLQGRYAGEQALFELEESDLVCWLDLREYLLPEVLELCEEGRISGSHHAVHIWVV